MTPDNRSCRRRASEPTLSVTSTRLLSGGEWFGNEGQSYTYMCLRLECANLDGESMKPNAT